MLAPFVLGALVAQASPPPSPSPSPQPLVINQQGTFVDTGVWMYETADGRFANGPGIKGTNESIVMPSPDPSPGATLAGVTLVRHKFDTLGYPLHIAMIEKLFAGTHGIEVFVADAYGVWNWKPGTHPGQERLVQGAGQTGGTARGPFQASSEAPPEYAAAFDFAKAALRGVTNLPDAQKNLDNYVVLFVETKDTVWVEFAPRFGPDEVPHLGCQTQLGRDMVFGYDKKHSGNRKYGEFLQCL